MLQRVYTDCSHTAAVILRNTHIAPTSSQHQSILPAVPFLHHRAPTESIGNNDRRLHHHISVPQPSRGLRQSSPSELRLMLLPSSPGGHVFGLLVSPAAPGSDSLAPPFLLRPLTTFGSGCLLGPGLPPRRGLTTPCYHYHPVAAGDDGPAYGSLHSTIIRQQAKSASRSRRCRR